MLLVNINQFLTFLLGHYLLVITYFHSVYRLLYTATMEKVCVRVVVHNKIYSSPCISERFSINHPVQLGFFFF